MSKQNAKLKCAAKGKATIIQEEMDQSYSYVDEFLEESMKSYSICKA
jgi:hypothetical protein